MLKKSISLIMLMILSLAVFTGCKSTNDAPDDSNYYKTKAGQKELQQERELMAREEQEAKDRAAKEANKGILEQFTITRYEDVPEGEPVEVFKIGSDLAVFNGGRPASVRVEKDYYATELWTYHWNDGKGASPGTMTMTSADGTVYGPWQAELVNNVYWVARPNQTIPAGNYIISDSNPATWSQNEASGGQGMTWMKGLAIQ